MRALIGLPTAIGAFLVLGVAGAQQPAQPAPAGPPPLLRATAVPNMSLEALLDQVAANTGRGFVLHARAPVEIVVGSIDPADVDYPQLLSILGNNELLAVEIEGRINVVPAAVGRAMPTRVVGPDAQDVPDGELVTMVIRLRNMPAPQAVPILRPLMPQWGHFAAMPEPNALVLVDQFANARRIAAILAELDR